MLHMCSSKFEIEQRELDFTKEYLSAGEAAAIQQERDSIQPLTNIEGYELISDDEEEDELSLVQSMNQGMQVGQRRPRSSTSESLDDEGRGLQLPEMPTEEYSVQARSGRIRKRPKLPDGFEIDKL